MLGKAIQYFPRGLSALMYGTYFYILYIAPSLLESILLSFSSFMI